MDSTDFDELINHFDNKIQIIYQLLPLAKIYDNSNDCSRNTVTPFIASHHIINNNNNSDNYTNQLINNRPDLRALSEMTIEMKTLIENMKSLLKQQKEEIIAQNIKCENELKLIESQCLYINQNIPTFLKTNNEPKTNKTSVETTNELMEVKTRFVSNKNEVSKPNAKSSQMALNKSNKSNASVVSKPLQDTKVGLKSVKKKTNQSNDCINPPTLSFITTDEFSSIPSYILGRLTYDIINRAIADFNRTISSKYKLIANYSTKYSDEQIKRYTHFKEQENNETKGEFFCTINDLKELSDLKVDNTIRKILTSLRHCKRIKEIRGNPPKLIRYAVIKSSVNAQNECI